MPTKNLLLRELKSMLVCSSKVDAIHRCLATCTSYTKIEEKHCKILFDTLIHFMCLTERLGILEAQGHIKKQGRVLQCLFPMCCYSNYADRLTSHLSNTHKLKDPCWKVLRHKLKGGDTVMKVGGGGSDFNGTL